MLAVSATPCKHHVVQVSMVAEAPSVAAAPVVSTAEAVAVVVVVIVPLVVVLLPTVPLSQVVPAALITAMFISQVMSPVKELVSPQSPIHVHPNGPPGRTGEVKMILTGTIPVTFTGVEIYIVIFH